MIPKKVIEHQGIIKQIDDSTVIVDIVRSPACSSCGAKSSCAIAEDEHKAIEVPRRQETFQVGETVNVVLEQSLGMKALFLGYIAPFLVLITTLIVISVTTNNEMISGIGAVAVLIPYYFLLFLGRKKLQRTFVFQIRKS